MKFKDLISENREVIKSMYLKPTYDIDAVQKVVDKVSKTDGTAAYIQYNEPRSRGKVGGGEVKEVTKDGVVIRDKFTGKDMVVPFIDITRLDTIKSTNESVETIQFDAKNTKNVEMFLKDNGYELLKDNNGRISVEIDGKEVTIFKMDELTVKNGKLVITKPFQKR